MSRRSLATHWAVVAFWLGGLAAGNGFAAPATGAPGPSSAAGSPGPAAAAVASPAAPAAKSERPKIWGVARTTHWVSSLQVARDFYDAYLGFAEAFRYPSPRGEVTVFKVSDRQFIEVLVHPDAKKMRRLVSLGFETSDVEGIRRYLAANGVAVPAQITRDQAGNDTFTFIGPDEHPIEFVKFLPGSLHRQSAGKFLSERRLAPRVHHVGFTVTDEAKAIALWVKILGCEEMWRAQEGSARPNYSYLRLPDCVENIEMMMVERAPEAHPCLAIADMQTALYTLKERSEHFKVKRPSIGRGQRWLLQTASDDGTPVELTEPFTIR